MKLISITVILLTSALFTGTAFADSTAPFGELHESSYEVMDFDEGAMRDTAFMDFDEGVMRDTAFITFE